jgi:hypothetical protein
MSIEIPLEYYLNICVALLVSDDMIYTNGFYYKVQSVRRLSDGYVVFTKDMRRYAENVNRTPVKLYQSQFNYILESKPGLSSQVYFDELVRKL